MSSFTHPSSPPQAQTASFNFTRNGITYQTTLDWEAITFHGQLTSEYSLEVRSVDRASYQKTIWVQGHEKQAFQDDPLTIEAWERHTHPERFYDHNGPRIQLPSEVSGADQTELMVEHDPPPPYTSHEHGAVPGTE